MSSRTWHGLLVPATLVAVAAAIANNGCSSSNNMMTSGDASTNSDASTIGRHPDSGLVEDAATEASAVATAPFDGTTGKACASDADCNTGAGQNVCSSDYTFTLTGLTAQGQFWPTPVCIMALMAGTGNCDPGPAGALAFCDSADPTDVTSPGLCLPVVTPQVAGAGNGVCLPACTFAIDGSPQQGCVGKDTCVPFTFLLDPNTNTPKGYGFCQGTCASDADCSALPKAAGTWACQVDVGLCVLASKQQVRTKALGTACTSADSTSGACNCFAGNSSGAGYCTSNCAIGGAACPNGYVCDAQETSTLVSSTGATVPGPSAQNPGLVGICAQACSLPDASAAAAGDDGGEGGAASAACVSSACSALTLAGPDCQPM